MEQVGDQNEGTQWGEKLHELEETESHLKLIPSHTTFGIVQTYIRHGGIHDHLEDTQRPHV